MSPLPSPASLRAGEPVPYGSTFRVVTHTFNVGRAPFGEPQVMRKHPGYIRNEKGGFFTS